MEFNKPVSNPMLLGCIELLKDEDTLEHREMFTEEFMKASFLAPALVNPAPIVDEEGNQTIAPGSQIQFPMLSTKDGKKLFVAFTDKVEYDSWQEKNTALPMFTLKVDDYARMSLTRDPMGNPSPAIGLVINPLSSNVVVSREMLAGFMTRRMAQNPMYRAMQQAQAAQAAAQKAASEEATGAEEAAEAVEAE